MRDDNGWWLVDALEVGDLYFLHSYGSKYIRPFDYDYLGPTKWMYGCTCKVSISRNEDGVG
jgi:hypothetical protein